MNSSLSTKIRSCLALVLSVLLLALTISTSWTKERPLVESAPNSLRNSFADSQRSLEEKVFSFQSRLFIGAMEYLRTQQHQGNLSIPTDELFLRMKQSYSEVLVTNQIKRDPDALAVRLIMANHLQLEDKQAEIGKLLQEVAHDDEITILLSALEPAEGEPHWFAQRKNLITPSTLGTVYEPDTAGAIRERFGWFGIMFLADVETNPDAKSMLEEEYREESGFLFKKASILAFFGLSFAVASFLSFCCLLFFYLRGKFVFRMLIPNTRATVLLETFNLYLLGMTFLPFVLESANARGWQPNVFLVNIFGILSLVLVLWWPRLCGFSWSALGAALGLSKTSITKFFADVVLGPLSYLASWTLFLVVLLAYSALMYHLQIDPNSGAHPVMPILVNSNEKNSVLYIILLAVVVAPLVEEFMFRGVLYSWLRQHLQARWAIILSSFLFAAVHPQGVVGIIPLMFIGMVLAFLREWRNNIVSPILAHACFNAGTIVLVLILFRT